MKRLIFLLLVFLVGFGVVYAETNPAQPPGVLTAEVAMAEYGIHEGIVTQPAVLVAPVTAERSSFLAIMADESFACLAIRPHSGYVISTLKIERAYEGSAAADFYLRC